MIAYAAATQRIDLDGQLLYEILFNDSTGQHFFSNPGKVKGYYPIEFTQNLTSTLTQDFSISTVSLTALGEASVSGARDGCGFCFAMVGFLLSTGIGAISSKQIHYLYSVVPVHLREIYSDPIELFYQSGMFYGSTFGTLASFRLAVEYEKPGKLCNSFSTILGLAAQEAASVDLLSTLMPPSDVNFESEIAPMDFISIDAISQVSESLDHLLNTVRENAKALTSQFFDATDIEDLFGLDENSSGDEIKQSAEHIAGSNDLQLGEELLESINMARYNVNAIRYNDALASLESGEACIDALLGFRDIIESQGLFSKALFYTTKDSFFRKKRGSRALLASLLMSESGILTGHLNSAQLFKHFPSINLSVEGPSDFKLMVATGNSIFCTDSTAAQSLGAKNLSQCLDLCLRDPQCNFVVFTDVPGGCSLYSACVDKSIISNSTRTYLKSEFRSPFKCWNQTSPGGECSVLLHERASRGNSHPGSMNWLTYYYESNTDMNEAIRWANESSASGDAEGTFNLARLSLKTWENHSPDLSAAKRLFLMMWNLDELPPTNPESYRKFLHNEMDQIEITAALEVAVQLGISDVSLQNAVYREPWSWAQKIGGMGGFLLVCLLEVNYVETCIVTLLALFPVLFFLISRKI